MDSNVLMSRNAAEYGIDPFQPQRQFIKKLRWWEPRDDLYKATQKDLELNEPEYGPLLQWFVREGERENWDESRLCKAIKDWSFSIPSQTTEYKMRKKMYPAVYKPPNLIPYFKMKLEWHRTPDLNKPWEAVAGTEHLQLRLNDFPDEILYTLMVDGRAIGDFNDFRSIWKR